MDRKILHCDINNCYASIECMLNPYLSDKPIIVGGSESDRHGIVLAKNENAKEFGIKTGEPIVSAKTKCKNLIIVSPHYNQYIKYSNMCKDIYYKYTNQVESFGIDEAWLDCSGSTSLFGDESTIAYLIKEEIKQKIGITISVGVSFNKIFAKLGSDMNKPDGLTIIRKDNFREKIWCKNVSALLGVGPSTANKLYSYGINTIGDLANTNVDFIKSLLGKNGLKLHSYANGNDTSIVYDRLYTPSPKSIGRGYTFQKDLHSLDEIYLGTYEIVYMMTNDLKSKGLKTNKIDISIRMPNLTWIQFSKNLDNPTNSPSIIADAAFSTIKNKFDISKKIRALSIRATQLKDKIDYYQITIDDYINDKHKITIADDLMYKLNNKFGKSTIKKCSNLINSYICKDIPENIKLPYYHL